MSNYFKIIQEFIIKSCDFPNEIKKCFFNAHNDDGNTIIHELAYAKCPFIIQKLFYSFQLIMLSTLNLKTKTAILTKESREI
jgi:hypothetical protein